MKSSISSHAKVSSDHLLFRSSLMRSISVGASSRLKGSGGGGYRRFITKNTVGIVMTRIMPTTMSAFDRRLILKSEFAYDKNTRVEC